MAVAQDNKDGQNTSETKAADFEAAILATGYGKFNYLLLLTAIPCCLSTMYETSTISYILPSAECDLHLSLTDKGILNAATYAGMITAAIPWGYLSDYLGRRKLLVYGYILDAICVLICAISQNVWILILFKYLGGLIMCGPFAILMSYLSEFHGTKHRARVMMVIGMCFSCATISLSLLAWGTIPQSWSLTWENVLTLNSWQIFMAISAAPSLIGGILIFFLPESPKFLMSKGRNAEALLVFQTIYSCNTGFDSKQYPIKELVDETQENTENDCEASEKTKPSETGMAVLRTVFFGITPLFRKPLVFSCLLVFTIQFCALLALNTIRLWMPQLFTMVSDFENANTTDLYDTNNLCSMIEFSVDKSKRNIEAIATIDGVCEVSETSDIYLNTIYVGLTGLVGYVLAGSLINICGSKNILVFGLLVSGCCGLGLYMATNTLTTVVLTSLFVSIGSICSTTLIGVVVNLFPTSLRSMTISLAMMFGRLGALIGNVIFPYLLAAGCLPPFLLVGLISIVCSGLCTILPKTSKKPLQ